MYTRKMGKLIIVILQTVLIAIVTSQLNNVRVPHGAMVEFEVEFINQRPGSQMASGMPAASGMMQMAAPAMGAPGSSLHRLLTGMTQTAMRLRRFYGVNAPLPPMEEPCPCDADCCQRPMEPRRILPIMDLPMTTHRGCCGCVDCPISLSPMVTYMIQSARTVSRRRMPAVPIDAK